MTLAIILIISDFKMNESIALQCFVPGCRRTTPPVPNWDIAMKVILFN